MKKIIYSSQKPNLTFENAYYILLTLTRSALILWLYLFISNPSQIERDFVKQKLSLSTTAYYAGMKELISKRYLVPSGENEWLFVPLPN